MRVYLQPPQPSRGLQRIADALARYAPSTVEVVDSQPDLTVIYAIGRRDAITRQVREILEQGRKYAMIQVCLRSTMSPLVGDWYDIWGEAEVVWSYYDLRRICKEDNEPFDMRFLHAPLGADSSVFYPRSSPPKFIIATSGVSRLQESVRECWLAAQAVGGEVLHVGNQTNWFNKQGITFSNGCDDYDLASMYSACGFVSGLRRTEGFELPAAEGLLCGCRPILFDTPDFRWNYKDWGLYIHEGTRQEVVNQLVEIFSDHVPQVTEDELSEARHWFNWERVCGEFWGRCLQ